jgi:hypothetical protein
VKKECCECGFEKRKTGSNDIGKSIAEAILLLLYIGYAISPG